MRVGDCIGDTRSQIGIGRADQHGNNRGVAFLDDRHAIIKVGQHGFIDTGRGRRTAQQAPNHSTRRKAATAARSVELGNRAQVEQIDHLDKRIARLQQLDLAGDHAGIPRAERGRRLVGGTGVDIAARLNQNGGRGFIQPRLEHEINEGGSK